MESHRKKMQAYEQDVKAIEVEHNTHLGDYNGIKAEMEKAAAEFKDMERQDVKFSEDIAFNEQKLAKLRQITETELDSAERYRVSMGEKLEAVYESLKGKAEDLRGPKEAKEKELIPLQKRLTEVRKEVEVAQTEAGLL